MKKNFVILISLLLSYVNIPLWSQVDPPSPSAEADSISGPEKYSLASMVEQILESPLLNSFKSRVEEKRALSRQAGIWPNPQGSFSVGQKSVDSVDGSIYEASLSQLLSLSGKLRSRVQVAEADAELAMFSQLEAEISLVSEAVRLAYDYEVNRKKVEFAQKRFERFDLVRAYLEGNIFASPQKKAERRIVQSRMREISAARIEAEAALQSSLERINLYFPAQSKALEIDVPWLAGNPLVDAANWKIQVSQHNLELAAQKTLVDKSRKERTLAKREAWPDLEPSVFYGRESAGDTERTAGVGLSLPLPVFNRNQGTIQSFQKKIEAEEKFRDFKEREIASRLGILLTETEAARQTLLKYPLSLAADLEKDFKEAEAEFRKGRMDFLVFVELESELAETYYRALDAQRTLVEKLGALFALSGRKDLVAELSKF